MKRRDFLKISSIATLPLILKSCDWIEYPHEFPITVHTDIHTGHLIFESQQFPRTEILNTKTLIVGGGIAGLSAANHLRQEDFLLCELSQELGGTSSSQTINGLTFAQGAHYDLAYPDYYGGEVLQLLQSLDIIKYQSWKNSWSFTDKQYIIPNARKNQCFQDGQLRPEVLPDGELKTQFEEALSSFSGKMSMPTTLIDPSLRHLNKITFLEFLEEHMTLTDEFKRGLDYHMLDDWGGTADQVSALAGIHYFKCRPYDSQVVDLFSPPDGNGYFIKKLTSGLSADQLLTNHLVKSIKRSGTNFDVEVIDVENRKIKPVRAKQIVYAGQKHALKFIMPEQFRYFRDTVYAPWLVLNFVLKNKLPKKGYWQNEMLMEDKAFMGFVDSDMQFSGNATNRVLTAYYCLPSKARADLKHVEENKSVIVEKTLGYLNQYFDQKVGDMVEQVFIKVLGHAMPVPKPGFLFNDQNVDRLYKNMTFAGVDNGRLPLLFEAMDSGIQAAKMLGV